MVKNGQKKQTKTMVTITKNKKSKGKKKMSHNTKIKFLIGMIIGIMAIALIDGATFDNKKLYDPIAKEIVIKNMFGLGSDLVKYKLEKNTDQCLIDCFAEGTITLNVKGKIYSTMEFLDKKGVNKAINNKVYIESTRLEDYYTTDCKKELEKETKNSSYIDVCSSLKKQKEVNYWKEYKGEDLEIGVYRWRIEGKKNSGESIDWQITTGGDLIGEQKLSEWAWWNSAWTSKRKILISENSGSDLYRYTIGYNVTWESGMNQTFSDIRMLAGNESTELDFWFEEGQMVDGKTATIWVMIPKITANDNTTIYMYFGNELATASGTNISKAFLVGDDFDASFDTTLWTTTTGAWTQANGFLNSTTVSGNIVYQFTGINYTGNAFIEWSSSGASGSGQQWRGVVFRSSANTAWYMGGSGYAGAKVAIMKDFNVPTVSAGSSGDFTTGVYYRFRTSFNGTEGTSINHTFISPTSPLSVKNDFTDVNYRTGLLGLLTYEPTSYQFYGLRNFTGIEPKLFIGDIEVNDPVPTVTANSPIDYYNSSISQVLLNCSATDGSGVLNASLIIDSIVNYTIYNTSAGQNLSLVVTRGFNDGVYDWNCTARDTNNLDGYSANRILYVDTKFPTLRTDYPTEGQIFSSFSSSVIINFNFSLHDTTLSHCKLFNGTANSTTSCYTNKSITITTSGNQYFGLYVNDSIGRQNKTEVNFNIYLVNVSDTSSHATIGEGENVRYSLIVNRTAIPITTAYLIFDNIAYYPDSIYSYVDSYEFIKLFTIPDGYGNSSGKAYNSSWNYSLDGVTTINRTTIPKTLTVYNVSIDNCTLYSDVILTMNLKDENDNFVINYSTVNDTNIQLDLTISSIINSSFTWEYSNTWINDSDGMIQICVPSGLLNYTNYTIDFTASYITNGYVQEFYHLDKGVLGIHNYFDSYTLNNINLYDLLTADSTTFLFTFLNANGGKVPNTIVHVFRRYIGDGIYREVERAKEDDNSETHVHLVEEDVIYYFIVTQDGDAIYTSSNYHAKCLSSPCAVSFSLGSTNINWDLINIDDKNYVIRTNKTSRMVYLDFTGNSSRTVNLSLFRMNYGREEYLNSTSRYAQSGTLSLPIPSSYGNQTFYVRIFSDGVHIRTELLDMKALANLYFGTLGVFLGGLMIVALVLMTASEGILVLITIPIGLIIISIMSLVDLSWLAIISLITYAVIIMIKILNRKRKGYG